MNCNHVEHNLGLLIDQQLSTTERLEVQNHLDQCANCQAQLTALAQAKQYFSTLQAPLLSEDFDSHLAAKLATLEHPSSTVEKTNNIQVLKTQPAKTTKPFALLAVAATITMTVVGLTWLMLSEQSQLDSASQLALEQTQPFIEIETINHRNNVQSTPMLTRIEAPQQLIYWSDVEVSKFDQFTQVDDGYQSFSCGSAQGERGCSLADDQMVASLTLTNI